MSPSDKTKRAENLRSFRAKPRLVVCTGRLACALSGYAKHAVFPEDRRVQARVVIYEAGTRHLCGAADSRAAFWVQFIGAEAIELRPVLDRAAGVTVASSYTIVETTALRDSVGAITQRAEAIGILVAAATGVGGYLGSAENRALDAASGWVSLSGLRVGRAHPNRIAAREHR